MQNSSRRLTRQAGGALELLLQEHFEQFPSRTVGDIEEILDWALHDLAPFLQDKASM